MHRDGESEVSIAFMLYIDAVDGKTTVNPLEDIEGIDTNGKYHEMINAVNKIIESGSFSIEYYK